MSEWQISTSGVGEGKITASFSDGVRVITYAGPAPADLPPSGPQSSGAEIAARNAAIWRACAQALNELAESGPLPNPTPGNGVQEDT
jgi:hypothetical protein